MGKNRYWKNSKGQIALVKNVTFREFQLMTWAGAQSFLTEEEFKQASQLIINPKSNLEES